MSDVFCQRCGHKWLPRVESPAQCPRCKRYDWRETEPVEAK